MNNLMESYRTRITAIHTQLQQVAALTLLDIQAEQTLVATAKPETMLLQLEIGAERSARELLRHTPPRRSEFEMAIEPIEDEIISKHRLIDKNSVLVTDNPELKAIALLAGIPDSKHMLLPIDVMERVFSRLAAVIQGKPASAEGIPEDNAFAMRLLILREFMHHLQFDSIHIFTNSAVAP